MSMDAESLAKTLTAHERVLLKTLKGEFSVAALVKMTGLQEIEIIRAAQWLQSKKLLEIKEDPKQVVVLDENGILYRKEGLPEKRFLQAIKGTMKVDDLARATRLSKEEVNVCIGTLKRKLAIEISKQGELSVSITEQGKKLLNQKSLEDVFLTKNFPVDIANLTAEEKFALEALKSRSKIVKIETIKNRTFALTKEGKSLQTNKNIETIGIERITPAIIRDGSWRGKTFRAYDVRMNVPKVFSGKAQPYADFVHQAREKLALMGFQEMTGPTIELEFWNFDALFQPQNHSARTWTATYSVKGTGVLPDKKIVQAVKAAHENGGNTGSTGWGGIWNPEIAARLMARAHDTAISPRQLSDRGLLKPGKYFSLVRCYRPDVIDATHGVEFNQLGGFVVGEDLNFANLLGLLRQFAKDMTGAEEFKFFPDYFPFTEPSVQISAKTPNGWMELCGAGVFRPEMCHALGIDEPVIAWGFGIDRLAMLKLDVKDIRDLFTRDLTKLRESKKVIL